MIQTNDQKMVALKMLKGAAYNPRVMPAREMDDLKRSLKEFGFVQAVIARKEDGLIIGGHQRLEAYRGLLKDQGLSDMEIGASPVPVIYLPGLDDTKTKLLNVALNKIHGEWDYDKLTSLFASLGDSAPIELSGFSKDEVGDMMSLLSGAAPLTAPSVDLDQQIADGLAAQARKFSFTLDADADAAVCADALKVMGMTGPGDAAAAFLRMSRVCLDAVQTFPQLVPAVLGEEQPAKKKGKKKEEATP